MFWIYESKCKEKFIEMKEKYEWVKGVKKIIKFLLIGLNGILMGFFRGVLL